ncbi:40s ribosomal protein s13 [Moesziomyces aphidis]|uniref:40s ribosomal protein s13 n=1 Tax=Moesziomyces aphidis TaxID=84754 RepID=W3VSY0_MOEAP|nr:40s ribosomal protein s13 [Moesziomyces aphidis]
MGRMHCKCPPPSPQASSSAQQLGIVPPALSSSLRIASHRWSQQATPAVVLACTWSSFRIRCRKQQCIRLVSRSFTAKGKGISASALPYRRTPPSWLKTTPEEVVEQIVKLARKGMTPSQIGVQLRDSQGIAQVRFVTGNKILRILKSQGLAPQIPEDLYHLIKKAVSVRKHLERNRKDMDSKFRLILIESRIHRLARYYKTKGAVPPTFKYEAATASTLVA